VFAHYYGSESLLTQSPNVRIPKPVEFVSREDTANKFWDAYLQASKMIVAEKGLSDKFSVDDSMREYEEYAEDFFDGPAVDIRLWRSNYVVGDARWISIILHTGDIYTSATTQHP
jgi:hypothetical protein